MKALQQFQYLGKSWSARALPQPPGALESNVVGLGFNRVQIDTQMGGALNDELTVLDFGASRETRARKRTQENLRENEIDLRQTTETIPVMLWTATPEGLTDYCNALLLDYAGLSFQEVVNEGWTQIFHPDDVYQARQIWMSCVASGAPFRAEVRTFRAAERNYRWCVTSALPLRDGQGRIRKWHGAIVDVHDWKEAQQELRNTQAELAHMTRVTALGEVAASIAHEVNQPLAAIITNGETGLRRLARLEPDIEKIRELIGRMISDARRAHEIVDRIRGMTTRQGPHRTALSLNDVIQASMELLRHEFQSRSVSVSLDLEPTLPCVVGDRTQLQQVVVNLAINAVQAMAQSVGTRRSISIRALKSDSKTVSCTVEDSGPGIEARHLPHLFESFFTTKVAGMGMGLSICRSIVEAHQGQIRADSESTLGGARFTFSLPANNAV
jgi:PAS domain S-box-containing protein